MERVKVDVKVDRMHPTVKLEVHFEDKPPRYHTVLQKSLIIAKDGTNIFLRRDTVEQLCRQNRSINQNQKLKILFEDGDNNLKDFPEQIYIVSQSPLCKP